MHKHHCRYLPHCYRHHHSIITITHHHFKYKHNQIHTHRRGGKNQARMGLQLGSYWGTVFKHWTSGSAKLFGVWFTPNFQVEKKLREVMNRMAYLIKIVRKKANFEKSDRSGEHLHHLAAVPCTSSLFIRLFSLFCGKTRFIADSPFSFIANSPFSEDWA